MFLFSLFSPSIYADKGGFSPVGNEVFESGQKAIIAWNGTDEIMILSTDVSANQESLVLEMLPLPSNPRIEKGDTDSFTYIEGLVREYFWVSGYARTKGGETMGGGGVAPPQVQVTFHAKIGAHDLTVVKVDNAQDFVAWIIDFMEDKGIEYGELPPNFETLISGYIEDGLNFFAFDMIEANSTVKSVDPIVYNFKSSFLYYPLQISSLFSGDTDILLFTLTSGDLDNGPILDTGFEKIAEFRVENEALERINSQIAELFEGYPYLSVFRYEGSLESFTSDIKAGFMSPYPAAVMAIGIAITIVGTISITFMLLIHPLIHKEDKEARLHVNE